MATTHKKFHLLVRAVVRDSNNILVARVKGGSYCFLPGGHHEIGETLAETVKREIKEEMGLRAEVKQYLGVVENNWSKNQYEINHIFEVKIPKLNVKAHPSSQEGHLEFFWIKPDDFKKQNLLPVVIQPLIADWLKGDKKIWHEANFK